MKVDDLDELRYFWRELRALRDQGQAFARRHPKVASRLQIDEALCPDPHVERLIESVAYLTSRVQRRLDDDFSSIADELLGIVSPHLVRPIPSMSIARFDADPTSGRLTTSFPIPAGAPLYVDAGVDVCRFRTCYPVELWPLRVVDAALLQTSELSELAPSLVGDSRLAAALRLRLEAPSVPFADLPLDRLRFFLDGDRLLTAALYDLVFRATYQVALLPDVVESDGGTGRGTRRQPILLPASKITEVGFDIVDEVLPTPTWSHPAYRLLQEYFVLPEKYYFFDLAGLARAQAQQHLDILFLLEDAPSDRLPVDASSFALGATPIINLFRRITEPIRLDHRRLEYRLVPDARRQATTEIYSIERVTTSADAVEPGRVVEPYYSFTHATEERDARVFWHGRRRPAAVGSSGTDVELSFFDLDLQPSMPPAEIVYAHTLCSNRDLAEKVPARARLYCDLPGVPVEHIVCLARPSPSLAPNLRGEALWRLVSNLTLGHLSLGDDRHSLRALREILTVYDPLGTPENTRQVRAIRRLEPRRVARRVTEVLEPRPLRGFARGLELTMTLDPDLFTARSPYLFAAVLRTFFALYAPLGSFVELRVRLAGRDEEIWSRWPPMAGEKIVA
ncbi:MAG: type VI secretion system baseplate subunit TssF [Acidobacteriota bacterium]